MKSVFISYAHADKDLKQRFVVHLSALERQRLIGVWHDGMLIPGEHLDSSIEAHLAAADLVILLVSPDFIYSDYCFEKEMQRAFARAKHGHCKVVAVLLKPCVWRELPIDEDSKLGDFVALPEDGKPVAQWPHEEGLHSAVEGIKHLITDKSASSPVTRRPKRDDSSQVRAAQEMFERDVWLGDAIWRVFSGTWDLPPYADRAPEGKSENQRFYDLVTDEFRQAAFDGRLPISAIRSNSALWDVVPQEFWKGHQISYLTALREEPTKLSVETWSPSRAPQQTNEWREFMTSKRAVDGYQSPPVPSGLSERRTSASPVSGPSSAHQLACPICKTPAEALPKLGDAEGFQCPVHEKFRVSGTVLAVPALRNASEQMWEKAWKRAKARQSGMIATICSGDFA